MDNYAEEMKKAREWSGDSIFNIKRTMELYGFSPLLAAAYNHASSLAVMIHGDRHKWNIGYAKRVLEERGPDAQKEDG